MKLTEISGEEYWDHRDNPAHGYCRPPYQQIAVALYMLGAEGATTATSQVQLGIGHGTIWIYTWRTIELLSRLLPSHAMWPSPVERYSQHPVFQGCIGFLDGSNIKLRYKLKNDLQSYHNSHKDIYRYNLQAICDWSGRFIWVAPTYLITYQIDYPSQW